MTKKETQRQKDAYVDKLGEKHRLFLDYDRDALMRLAIADWNFKNPRRAFDDRTITEIIERVDAETVPEGTKDLFVINNPMSRRRGLHRLLGPRLFSLVARDATVFGRMVRFSKDVRTDHAFNA